MWDEEDPTQTLSKTSLTPGASSFQSSHSTERKSDPQIRVSGLRDRGSTDTRSSKGGETEWNGGKAATTKCAAGLYVLLGGCRICAWMGRVTEWWWGQDGAQSCFFFFKGGKGWLINGFRPPGEMWFELPVLFSHIALNWMLHVLFL